MESVDLGMAKLREIHEVMLQIGNDGSKFFDKGNKAAAVRARKSLQDLKQLAQDLRVAIQRCKTENTQARLMQRADANNNDQEQQHTDTPGEPASVQGPHPQHMQYAETAPPGAPVSSAVTMPMMQQSHHQNQHHHQLQHQLQLQQQHQQQLQHQHQHQHQHQLQLQQQQQHQQQLQHQHQFQHPPPHPHSQHPHVQSQHHVAYPHHQHAHHMHPTQGNDAIHQHAQTLADASNTHALSNSVLPPTSALMSVPAVAGIHHEVAQHHYTPHQHHSAGLHMPSASDATR